jgi:microcystin-dependent protein
MTKLAALHEILNDTPADATFVDENYDSIVQYVNNELVNADGSVAMQAQLHLVGDPVNDDDAARKRYVDRILPVGVIMPYGGLSAPAGGDWSLCDGTGLSKTTYPRLFDVLQYTYGGSGDTFMKPNLMARFPVGFDSTVTAFNVVGNKGGTFTVPVPQHAHVMSHNHGSVNSGNNTTDHVHAINPPIGTTSSSGAHQHNGDIAAHGTVGGNSSVLKLPGAGTNAANVVDASVAHQHTLDLGSFNSGVNTTDHIHTVDLPDYVGNTANAGTASAQMIQPYIALNFIIRIT